MIARAAQHYNGELAYQLFWTAAWLLIAVSIIISAAVALDWWQHKQ